MESTVPNTGFIKSEIQVLQRTEEIAECKLERPTGKNQKVSRMERNPTAITKEGLESEQRSSGRERRAITKKGMDVEEDRSKRQESLGTTDWRCLAEQEDEGRKSLPDEKKKQEVTVRGNML